jgi:6-pyruvoyl-tetrahydropterin synthase
MNKQINDLNIRLGDPNSMQTYYYEAIRILKLIITLDEKKYAFTQQQFDSFITCLTYRKTSSFLNRGGYKVECGDIDKAFKIMFTKFTPNKTQFNSLCACYTNKDNDNYFYIWIDILNENNYKFSDSEKDKLIKINYNMEKLLINNENINLEDFKNMLIVFEFDINQIQKIINKVTEKLDANFINWLIYNIKHYPNYIEILTLFATKLKELNTPIFNSLSTKYIISKEVQTNLVYKCIELGFKIDISETLLIKCANNKYLHELLFYLYKKYVFQFNANILNILLMQNNSNKIIFYGRSNEYNPGRKLLDLGYNRSMIAESNIKGDINLYNFMKALGVKPNIETINMAIKIKDKNIFDDCIKNFKIIPDNSNLYTVLKGYWGRPFDEYVINIILCYKVAPNNEDLNGLCERDKFHDTAILNSLVQLLINNGLILNLETVGKLLFYDIHIDNLERFGIKYDGDLYNIGYKYDKYYYIDKIQIDKNILVLREMSKNKTATFKDFKKYIGLLDRYCLDYLICNNPNVYNQIIRMYKCKPTLGKYYWSNPNDNNILEFVDFCNSHGIDDKYLSERVILM